MYQKKFLSDQMFIRWVSNVDDVAAHFNIGVSAAIQVLRNMTCLNMAVGGGGGGRKQKKTN